MIKAVKKVLKSRNKSTGMNLYAKQWKDRIYINGGGKCYDFYIDSFGDPHFKMFEPGLGPRLLADLIKIELNQTVNV